MARTHQIGGWPCSTHRTSWSLLSLYLSIASIPCDHFVLLIPAFVRAHAVAIVYVESMEMPTLWFCVAPFFVAYFALCIRLAWSEIS